VKFNLVVTDLAKKFFVSHITRRFLAISTRCCSEASESSRQLYTLCFKEQFWNCRCAVFVISQLTLTQHCSYPVCTGVDQPGREADNSPQCSANVKNVWSICHICLHCVPHITARDNVPIYRASAFSKNTQCSWKSVQWEPICSMRTDGQTWRS